VAFEFQCKDCGKDIVVRFLHPGEIAACKSCGARQPVPETADRIGDQVTLRYFDASRESELGDFSADAAASIWLNGRVIYKIGQLCLVLKGTRLFQWVSSWPLTTVLLVVSLAGLSTVTILFLSSAINRGQRTLVYLDYSGSQEFRVEEVLVDLRYHSKGSDEANLAVKLAERLEPYENHGEFTFNCSNNLVPTDEWFGERTPNKKYGTTLYKLPLYGGGVWQDFRGNIFHGMADEFKLDFLIDADRFLKLKSTPIIISISGISGVSLTDVYPQPTRRSLDTLLYRFPSLISGSGQSISIAGIDRRAALSIRLHYFVYGALIATFAGILAPIVSDLGRRFDVARRENRQAKTGRGQQKNSLEF